MAGLPDVAQADRLRARRWDAIILGSGISGLVAAARLGATGRRVLVAEEAATRALHPSLREPFFLAGVRDRGVLDACLRELNIPLIDQRRIVAERLAYQVVSPKFRIDVGGPQISADELASWGVCSPSEAGALMRALVEATEAERRAMLASPVVRIGRRLGLGRPGVAGSHVRGLPAEAAQPSDALAPVLEAQLTALSNLALAPPTPEARARLLGTALAGGAGFEDGPPWLVELLRRRVETVYGEFRSLGGRFSLVSVDQQPGIVNRETGELWVGRALLLAAPTSALAAHLLDGAGRGDADPPLPDFLTVERVGRRRVAVQLRAERDALPRGMCPRLILMSEAGAGGREQRVVTLNASACAESAELVDLVGRMTVSPDEDPESVRDEIEQRVHAVMPFARGRIVRRPHRPPSWDDGEWIEDPLPGTGWPTEVDLKVSSRPAVYRLDRAEVGGIGLEGDLLLGWRAGDAVAGEVG